MHGQIADMVRRHQGSQALADELQALFSQHPGTGSVVTTLVEGYESVDVDHTFIAGDEIPDPS